MASTFSSSSRSYNRPPRSQRERITSEQVSNLRSNSSQEVCPVQKFAFTFADSVKQAFASLCAPRTKAVNAMCKNYGHVIEGTWTGKTPKCCDCGAPVTAPEMLRKAVLNPAVARVCATTR